MWFRDSETPNVLNLKKCYYNLENNNYLGRDHNEL